MSKEEERAKARVDLVKAALKAQDEGDEDRELQARLLLRPAREEEDE